MATPKSTRERVLRHIRPKKLTPRQVDLVGRVVPKKTANNDPTRGGARIDSKLTESVAFLASCKRLTGQQLQEAVDKFPNKIELCGLLDHLLAVSSEGWTQWGDDFLHEATGRTACPKNWKLVEGRLCTHSGKKPSYQADWLRKVRSYCA